MEWTICEKDEDGTVQYCEDAIKEALGWFFVTNQISGDAASVYRFLLQFLGTEQIKGDYGRLFFRQSGAGLEFQKFDCSYGYHDDHSDVTSLYLDCATEAGQPCTEWAITVDPATKWLPLEETSEHYRKEWFQGCTDAMWLLEEETVMGSYYSKVISPVFLITDLPSASGYFLLKKKSVSD